MEHFPVQRLNTGGYNHWFGGAFQGHVPTSCTLTTGWPRGDSSFGWILGYLGIPIFWWNHIPYAPCMVYLSTFGWFVGQMLVNIPCIPCMEHMGIIPNPSSTTLCGNIDRGFSFIPWAYGIIPSLYIQVSSCSLPSMVPSSCFGQQKRYPRIRWSQNVKMGCI